MLNMMYISDITGFQMGRREMALMNYVSKTRYFFPTLMLQSVTLSLTCSLF